MIDIDNYNDISSLYPIGTEVLENGYDLPRIDTIAEYIIDKNGMSVVLTLDAYIRPRLSRRISLEEFCEDWTVIKKAKEKESKKGLKH